MYVFVLIVHGTWRWAVIAAGVLAVVLAVTGYFRGNPSPVMAERVGRVFTVFVDIQVLLGAALYFVFSPLTTTHFTADAAAAPAEIPFVLVEHVAGMALAFVLVHVVSARIGKAPGAAARYGWAAVGYGATLALILASVPWSRPLLRF